MFCCCRVVRCHFPSLTTCLAGYSEKPCLSVQSSRPTACGIWPGGSESTSCAGVAWGRTWKLGRICENHSTVGIWLVLSSRLRCLSALAGSIADSTVNATSWRFSQQSNLVLRWTSCCSFCLAVDVSFDYFVEFPVCACVSVYVCNCLLPAVSRIVCCFICV